LQAGRDVTLPARISATICATSVPMPWNSGICTNWTPGAIWGLAVASNGSAAWMAPSTMGANGAASRYSGRSYVLMRVPGGTAAQPRSAATSSM